MGVRWCVQGCDGRQRGSGRWQIPCTALLAHAISTPPPPHTHTHTYTLASPHTLLQDILVGLLRLRKVSGPARDRQPELRGACSVVRELHVYGTAVAVHARDASKFQHQARGEYGAWDEGRACGGRAPASLPSPRRPRLPRPALSRPVPPQSQGYGTLLMLEAERIARCEHRSAKLAVISGVGTRHYYRRLGCVACCWWCVCVVVVVVGGGWWGGGWGVGRGCLVEDLPAGHKHLRCAACAGRSDLLPCWMPARADCPAALGCLARAARGLAMPLPPTVRPVVSLSPLLPVLPTLLSLCPPPPPQVRAGGALHGQGAAAAPLAAAATWSGGSSSSSRWRQQQRPILRPGCSAAVLCCSVAVLVRHG